MNERGAAGPLNRFVFTPKKKLYNNNNANNANTPTPAMSTNITNTAHSHNKPFFLFSLLTIANFDCFTLLALLQNNLTHEESLIVEFILIHSFSVSMFLTDDDVCCQFTYVSLTHTFT